MVAQKGSGILIKFNDGSLRTIGGLRSGTLTINQEPIDISASAGTPVHERILLAGGTESVSVSGSGILAGTDVGSIMKRLDDVFVAQRGGSFATQFQIVLPALGTYTGVFMIASLEFGGEFNGEATFSISLESSGFISLA
jgi:TP901-1 family phage major tail protein